MSAYQLARNLLFLPWLHSVVERDHFAPCRADSARQADHAGYIKAGFGLIALVAVSVSGASAKDIDRVKELANNFSHENLICGAYYLFVSQCLKNKNASDPVVGQYLEGGNTFLQRGIETGRIAAVSDKAINAKVEIALEEMKRDTENNCVNISVLFKKHAYQCKATFDEGPGIFADRLTRMGLK